MKEKESINNIQDMENKDQIQDLNNKGEVLDIHISSSIIQAKEVLPTILLLVEEQVMI
jgi:hypothetical protein